MTENFRACIRTPPSPASADAGHTSWSAGAPTNVCFSSSSLFWCDVTALSFQGQDAAAHVKTCFGQECLEYDCPLATQSWGLACATVRDTSCPWSRSAGKEGNYIWRDREVCSRTRQDCPEQPGRHDPYISQDCAMLLSVRVWPTSVFSLEMFL